MALLATFASTGSSQSWVVPAGVTLIEIEARGGGGGAAFGDTNRSHGAILRVSCGVTPGESLQINVAGQGFDGVNNSPQIGGWNGGGSAGQRAGSGGGASDVRQGGTTPAERIVVAGGGGGAGSNHITAGGTGGDGGGNPGATGSGGTPGATGGGGDGGDNASGGLKGNVNAQTGSFTSGGIGAAGEPTAFGDGNRGGGGGGGGFYGGGGGGDGRPVDPPTTGTGGGGGGGGAIFYSGTLVSVAISELTGDGVVNIYGAVPIESSYAGQAVIVYG